MIIVLTGATGLIGNALGQRLVREGHEVRALVRRPDPTATHYPCQLHAWDIHQPAPTEALRGADVVIHLAGENIAGARWSEARKQSLRESRVLGAQSLQAGLVNAQCKLKVFISASGVGYYGDRADEWLDETSSAGDDFLARLCVEWEAATAAVLSSRTVMARFGVVLSAKGGFLSELTPLFQRFGASRLGTGRAWLSWIHIDDLIEVLMFALVNDQLRGSVNCVAPEPASNGEVTEVLRRALVAFSAPAAPALAIRTLYGELATALLGSQRVRPAGLQVLGFRWRFRDFDSAVQNLLPGLKVGETQLVFEQWLPFRAAEIWPFFSSEQNLERITPPFLSFKVLGRSGGQVEIGTLIDYRLKLHGLPLKWRTRISDWQVGRKFVDEQISGPYSKWHHTHTFEALGSGTLMRDTIVLKPPMGWLGRAVSLGFILKDVKSIFAYRSTAIGEIFSRPR